MAPSKLSDSDKQQIANLYCQPGETTSTLADRFGVSSSTVSRVLKQMLSDDDYGELMQWKRSGERGELNLSFAIPAAEEVSEDVALPDAATSTDVPEPTLVKREREVESEKTPSTSEPVTNKRSRRRSAAPQTSEPESEEETTPVPETETAAQTESTEPKAETTRDMPKLVKKSDRADKGVADHDVAAWVSEGLGADDYEEDDDDDDDDWDEEDWDDEADEDEEVVPRTSRQEELAILSFESFELSKPCYLVVDRLAELITCPLREFAELGVIPAEEEQARTLPVFDNHRVARRFARRNQRIIKIPNGLLLNKTQEYLQAKGITRLLFDGQVYALN